MKPDALKFSIEDFLATPHAANTDD